MPAAVQDRARMRLLSLRHTLPAVLNLPAPHLHRHTHTVIQGHGGEARGRGLAQTEAHVVVPGRGDQVVGVGGEGQFADGVGWRLRNLHVLHRVVRGAGSERRALPEHDVTRVFTLTVPVAASCQSLAALGLTNSAAMAAQLYALRQCSVDRGEGVSKQYSNKLYNTPSLRHNDVIINESAH